MKTVFAASVVCCLAAIIASGPEVRVAGQDATGVLREVDQALGASSLKSIRYSATGFAYAFLQNPRPDVRYPKFYAKYTRSIDFEKGVSREETTRAQFENPPSGGGQQPLYTDTTGAAVTGESSAWGGGAVALTPQGFVRAAMAAKATLSQGRVDGRPATVVSFMVRDTYKVNGYVNAQHLIERIETWTPQPTLGDMSIETTFSDYRDFGGVKFPGRIVQKQWIYPVLELNVTTVEPNVAIALQAPAGGPQGARVESTKVADGVWYLAGTPDPNSQLVEFKDFLVLVALTKAPRKAEFVYVKDRGKYVISDGTRSMEVYHVANGHSNNLLMSYLPKEKLLMITDIFNDFGMPRPNDPPPGLVSPYYAALDTRLKELRLDVERLAPSHGRAVAPYSQFADKVQGKVQAPAPRPITETR